MQRSEIVVNDYYLSRLVNGYGKIKLNLRMGRTRQIVRAGTKFNFKMTECPKTGRLILESSVRFANDSVKGAPKLVLIIEGADPCKDKPYDFSGYLKCVIPDSIITTRLAILDLRKPRRERKYRQMLRRAQEQMEDHTFFWEDEDARSA